MAAGALAIPRGCGTRVAGGCYLETGLGPGGRPVEYFLIDPPLKLVPEALAAMGIRPIGITLVERQGIWHVIDWVGSGNYPNPADFLEEVRVGGLSRRVPRGSDFSKLTADSHILLVHSRAWVDNAQGYYEALRAHDPVEPYQGSAARVCPKGIPGHNDVEAPPAMCVQLYWQDVTGGEPAPHEWYNWPRRVRRPMPAFDYYALAAPPDVQTTYTPAVFASFPLTRIAVVNDPDGGSHIKALEATSKAGLPVELTDN